MARFRMGLVCFLLVIEAVPRDFPLPARSVQKRVEESSRAEAVRRTTEASPVEPIVHYHIEATLDVQRKAIRGRELLRWKNDSSDRVSELQFHLYLNAFKNSETTFMRESRGTSRVERFDYQHWGYIEVRSLKIVGGEDLTRQMEYIQPDDGNPADQTVMRVVLPRPVLPAQSITLEIEFSSQLPRLTTRSGFFRDFFFVAQWFPKIGVYEKAGMRGRLTGGWNCHQYHATSEFYATFGTYDVALRVPKGYEVGATGGVPRATIDNGDGTITYRFVEENVHDFAWTASPRFLRRERDFIARREVSEEEIAASMRLFGLPREDVELGDVKVILLIQPEHADQIERHFRAAFQAIKYFGLWYGRYPYATLTIVDPPRGGEPAGGMEYPTLITAGTVWWAPRRVLQPEGVIVHEFGHQYWYGLVATNEFEEAWLDEGFNTYSTGKVLEKAYGPNYLHERFGGIPLPGMTWMQVPVPPVPFVGVGRVPLGSFLSDIAQYSWQRSWSLYIERPAVDDMKRAAWEYYDLASYRVNSYMKPELLLRTLEGYLGEEMMARVLRRYYQRFRFRHPTTEDFIETVREVTGQDMRWFFSQVVYGSGILDYAVAEIRSEAVGHPRGVDPPALPTTGTTLFESSVTIRRFGTVTFPVEIEIVFETGERRREHWDGHQRWYRLHYLRPARVVQATVDPDRRVFLDVNWTNNSRRLTPDRRATYRWAAKWLLWVQNLLHQVSLLS
jgi:hypothetical protein